MSELKCTNGHDRCAGGPFEGCPYCVRVPDRRPQGRYKRIERAPVKRDDKADES